KLFTLELVNMNEMNEICKTVTSQKGKVKLNIYGFLFVKECVVKNTYYWSCKKKKSENCPGHAVTIFSNSSYFLKKTAKHEYSPQASSSEVAIIVEHIKQQARETQNSLAQIIQNNTAAVDKNLVSYMPSKDALCMRIKHIRGSEMPPQPQTLDEVDVLLPFQSTLKRELFYIRDSQSKTER
ncbi:28440_t:CDS:2, partial [Dentiscutata erythropus]